ncbi:methyl-accepting chemotaxis protein [Paenibacillus sp. B2(2019)]|uniref:methyl-accepting chemotaxis protein n=1 Tax=Paenibacillus sp. B2(2019) TaxID=2607754 RepID=UPI0011F35274|nr:methyl-accepting chemotaxis protein [Paenibacillus sp. B2(2019)]KAA1191052.1 HAMP domain-containing protein [Paenibacillus sp. B2(2019)]
MFRNIRGKMILGFTAVIVVFLVAIAGNTWFQGKATMLTDQVNRNWNKLSLVQGLTDKIRTADELGARYVMSNTEAERKSYLSKYEETLPLIENAIKELESVRLNEEELKGVTELKGKWNDYLIVLKEAFALAKDGNFPEAQKKFTNLSLDAMIESQIVFQSMLMEAIQNGQSQAEAHRNNAMITSFGVTGLSVVLALILALLISGRIIKPLRDVNTQLKEIADGDADLTRKLNVRSKDEIGELAFNFNKMTENLGSMIEQVKLSANSLANSSTNLTSDSGVTAGATERISDIIGEVALGTAKQMNDLQTNTISFSEISIGIGQIASSVQDISEASHRSASFAIAGDESLQAAGQQVESINRSIHSLSQQVQGFVNRSQEIGSAVGVIKGIASQTNMLALNATIEAARAGEQGRGFAVVADQVRKLAEQSTESANQIAEMASGIQSEADNAMKVMMSSMSEVRGGTEIIQQAGRSFSEIRLSIDSLAEQVQEVSGAVEEITAATDEIVESLRSVTTIAETTAASTQHVSVASQEQRASVEQIASSASELNLMAHGLQGLVVRFNV